MKMNRTPRSTYSSQSRPAASRTVQVIRRARRSRPSVVDIDGDAPPGFRAKQRSRPGSPLALPDRRLALQVHALELTVEGLALNAQNLGSPALVAPGRGEYFADLLGLSIGQRLDRPLVRVGFFERPPRVFAVKHRRGRQNHDLFDQMLQLAHIAGPSVFLEGFQRGLAEPQIAPVVFVVAGQKMPDQERDIAAAFPQRGNAQAHHIEPEPEILAEFSGFDELGKI